GFVFVTIAWSSYYDRTMNCPGRGFAPHAGPSGTARMISPRESTPWAVSLHTTECRDPRESVPTEIRRMKTQLARIRRRRTQNDDSRGTARLLRQRFSTALPGYPQNSAAVVKE